MLSCAPAHHYPSLHSIHSDSEQRKWLSDITTAPVSAALSPRWALCVCVCVCVCVRYEATSERAVGYGADLAYSTTSTWPRDSLLGHPGHAVLQLSRERKDSDTLDDISVSINIKLFLSKEQWSVGTTTAALNSNQPQWQKQREIKLEPSVIYWMSPSLIVFPGTCVYFSGLSSCLMEEDGRHLWSLNQALRKAQLDANGTGSIQEDFSKPNSPVLYSNHHSAQLYCRLFSPFIFTGPECTTHIMLTSCLVKKNWRL